MNPKIYYYPNGNKKYESYFYDLNYLNNKDGPTVIEYYESGNKRSETYYIDGKHHNTKGPSYIRYSEDGRIEFKEYCLNGKLINVSSDEEFQKYIKRLNIK